MNILVIGNIIAFFASILTLVIGILKSRERIIFIQTIQFLLFTVSNFILGGFTGAIANFLGMIRNILCYKEKLTKLIVVLIIIISSILTFAFNNLGFIGLLPLINTVIYTVFINVKNALKFKLLFVTTAILWFIYDLTIKSYSSAIFDFTSIIAGLISSYQIYKNTHNKKITN